MDATMRSINRALIVIGAPLGGLLGDRIGYRSMLWIAALGFLAVAASPGCPASETLASTMPTCTRSDRVPSATRSPDPARGCILSPIKDRPPGRLRCNARGHVTMHAARVRRS